MPGPSSPFYYLLDDEDNLDFKSYEERIADLENERRARINEIEERTDSKYNKGI